MLRKTSIAGVISLLLAPSCFAGFYVGASVGPEGASFSQKAHVVRYAPDGGPGTFNVVDKQHFSGLGVFGSIFAGYGWTYNRFYLAGEVNANISSLQYKLTNTEYINSTVSKTTFEIKNSEGVSLLPGYFLSDNTLVYARVGYANGKLKIVESDPTIKSFNKNRNGIRYGLGIKHNLTTQWALMMDYSQINYSSVKGSTFEPIGGVLKTTKITPNTAQVGFGVIYNFDQPQPVYVK